MYKNTFRSEGENLAKTRSILEHNAVGVYLLPFVKAIKNKLNAENNWTDPFAYITKALKSTNHKPPFNDGDDVFVFEHVSRCHNVHCGFVLQYTGEPPSQMFKTKRIDVLLDLRLDLDMNHNVTVTLQNNKQHVISALNPPDVDLSALVDDMLALANEAMSSIPTSYNVVLFID